MIGNKFLSVAGASEPTDAQFNYVTMLLHGDGTNGAQNNTFLDSSTNNFTITRNGNTTQGSFSPYGSNWSNFFGGSDYLTGPTTNSAFDFGSGDWTIETWAFPTSFSSQMAVFISLDNASSSAYAVGLLINTNGSAQVYQYGGSYFINSTSTTGVVSLNTWSHIAAVRSGSTFAIFVNGTRVASVTGVSGTQAANKTVNIGQDPYASNLRFNGYLSNLRVVKGTAVYSPADSTITVPTTALTAISGTSLLTCQSNRFKDSSSNSFTITPNGSPSVQRFNPFGTSTAYSTATIGGSGYFDGTGDYLNTPSTGQFTASGDFTVSCWFYLLSFANSYYVVGGNWASATSDEWLIQISNAGQIRFLTSAGTSFSATGKVVLNQWMYFSATRSGTTVTVKLNGETLSTYTKSDTLGAASKAIEIGQQPAGYWPFNGYISDFRLLSGTADTAIPTAPASPTSTGLMLNFTNAAIYDNAMMNDLETVGNAQISTSVKKYGTGSLYFDGTGDYLRTPYMNVFSNQWRGDGTIECWVYFNSTANSPHIWSLSESETVRTTLHLTGAVFKFYTRVGGTGVNIITSGTSISTNQWYHIAITRSGSTWTMWLDGVSQGTSTNTTRPYGPNEMLAIGWQNYSGASGDYLNGYIDDFRITNGYARYTTTFTPPTQALADKSSS